MTYKNIQDEVIALRFDTSLLSSVKQWINMSYAKIWAEADWVFKHVNAASFSVVGGNNSPTMPADFGEIEGLYDNFGTRIEYLAPDVWRDFYSDPTIPSSATSVAYTVVNGQVLLGPTPGSSATYKLAYERRVSYLATGVTLTQGAMSGDTDVPLWPAEYHYALVLDACLIGGNLMDDLGAPAIQAERDALLAAMKDDLTSETSNEPGTQWGGNLSDSYAGFGW